MTERLAATATATNQRNCIPFVDSIGEGWSREVVAEITSLILPHFVPSQLVNFDAGSLLPGRPNDDDEIES
jgi:hypothetical protein